MFKLLNELARSTKSFRLNASTFSNLQNKDKIKSFLIPTQNVNFSNQSNNNFVFSNQQIFKSRSFFSTEKESKENVSQKNGILIVRIFL
jgi:hypothetical protein